MKRAALALFTIVFITALVLPVSQAIGGASFHEPPICQHVTAARVLEDPALAQEWAQALRSAEPRTVDRVRALIAQIRAVHGCMDELLPPQPAPRLPPGHPPVADPDALPPGHPPIADPDAPPPGHPPIPSSPSGPPFGAPAVLTI
jgi:hypothetical protein